MIDKLKLYEYNGIVYILDGSKMWVYDGNTIAEVECTKPDFISLREIGEGE